MLFDTETNETISTASMGSISSPQVENGSGKLPNIIGNTMTPTIHNGPTFGHRGPTSMGNVMYEKKGKSSLAVRQHVIDTCQCDRADTLGEDESGHCQSHCAQTTA